MDAETETETPQLPGAWSLFAPSWRALRTNLETFVEQIAAPFVCCTLGAALFLIGQHATTLYFVWEAVGALILMLGIVLFLALVPALAFLQLQGAKGVPVGYAETLHAVPGFFWRMWGLVLCLTIMIGGGLFLLVVPGMFAWQRFLYAPYLLIDKHLGVLEALRESSYRAKRHNRDTWSVVGTQVLIDAPGMIIPLFGSLASSLLGIVYFCAPAVRYWQIHELEVAEKAAGIAAAKRKNTGSAKENSKSKTQSRTKKRS